MILILAIESQVWSLQFFPNSPKDTATGECRGKGKGSLDKVVIWVPPVRPIPLPKDAPQPLEDIHKNFVGKPRVAHAVCSPQSISLIDHANHQSKRLRSIQMTQTLSLRFRFSLYSFSLPLEHICTNRKTLSKKYELEHLHKIERINKIWKRLYTFALKSSLARHCIPFPEKSFAVKFSSFISHELSATFDTGETMLTSNAFE